MKRISGFLIQPEMTRSSGLSGPGHREAEEAALLRGQDLGQRAKQQDEAQPLREAQAPVLTLVRLGEEAPQQLLRRLQSMVNGQLSRSKVKTKWSMVNDQMVKESVER